MKDDRVYLLHIRDAIARIESYTSGDKSRFLQDTMIQDAVIRNLEVIGEAVKNLSADLRSQHPQVPWGRIAGMRDVSDSRLLWRATRTSLERGPKSIAGAEAARHCPD